MALNQEAFDRIESYELAKGRQFGRLKHTGFGDKYMPDGGYNGGIENPEFHPIPLSSLLIRFGGSAWKGSDPFAGRVAAGEWWLDYDNLVRIVEYARAIDETLAYAVRQTCAVPDDWSDMTLLITGYTRSPLWAYKGLGNVAFGKKVTIDPKSPGKPAVEQLYIPGLNDPDLRRQALIVRTATFLHPAMSKPGALARMREQTRIREILQIKS